MNAEGWTTSEGGIETVSARRVFRYLQMDAGPRRSPSASSEMVKKKRPLPEFLRIILNRNHAEARNLFIVYARS